MVVVKLLSRPGRKCCWIDGWWRLGWSRGSAAKVNLDFVVTYMDKLRKSQEVTSDLDAALLE